jgi:hypothetical protein
MVYAELLNEEFFPGRTGHQGLGIKDLFAGAIE